MQQKYLWKDIQNDTSKMISAEYLVYTGKKPVLEI